MGCNCKKNIKKIEKYSDNSNTISSEKPKKNVKFWLNGIINYLLQIILVIFGIGLFIIIAPILLMYVLLCVILRKRPTLTIKRFTKQAIGNG